MDALYKNEGDDVHIFNVAMALQRFPHEVEMMPAIDFINFRRLADKQALADFRIFEHEKNT